MSEPPEAAPVAVRRGLDGAMLVAWRSRMGFTQRDACQELGCSRAALGRWETNKNRVPRYIGLACAALALGMPAYGAEVQEEVKEC